MTRLSPVVLFLLSAACGATGTTSGTTSSSSGGNGDFITASLDGTAKNATHNVGGRLVQQNHVQLSAATDALAPDVTYVLMLPNAVGTHTCGEAQSATAMTINRPDGAAPVFFDSNGPNGACSIVVTQAAANVGEIVEGTFSGVGSNDPAGDIQVTNGSFRITRTQ